VRHYWEYIGNNTKSYTPPSSKREKPELLGWLTSLAARMFFGLPEFFAIFGLG
jgi:hypothetical protein